MNDEFVGLGKKSRTVFSLDSTFTFGKYKDYEVKEVCECDPDYIKWVHENVSWMEFADEVLEYAQQLEGDDESAYELDALFSLGVGNEKP